MKIGLPLAQYFEQVKADLFPLMGAVISYEEKDLNKIFENKDILFHANGFIDDNFDEIVNNRRFLERINSYVSLLSFDLGPSCRRVDRSKDGYIAKSPILSENQILRIADKKINNIRKYFQGIISVENLDYHPSGAYEIICTPEFIYSFVKKFNIYLTLDIGHLEVTCSNLSMNAYNYLEKLPLSNVVEIHLSHSQGVQDSHMLPTEEEYKMLDFIFGYVHPHYIVIEYYYEPEGIIRENRKLVQFLKNFSLYES